MEDTTEALESHALAPQQTTLKMVDDNLFKRVWAIMCELGERQRHFNGLQSHYRTMASTWLLGTLAGIGLIYSDKVTLPVSQELLAATLAAAAAIGIVLLWMLDILVYHELLVANYKEGKKLERDYPWLPQVRHTYSLSHSGAPVRVRASRFYIASAQLLLIIAAVAVLRYASATSDQWWPSFAGWLLVVLAIGGGLSMMWYVRGRFMAKRRTPARGAEPKGITPLVHNILLFGLVALCTWALIVLNDYNSVAATVGAFIFAAIVIAESIRQFYAHD